MAIDRKTTAKEALTCYAISYLISRGSSASIQEFSNIIYEYYFEGKDSELKKYSSHLRNGFYLGRIQEFNRDSKSGIVNKASALREDTDSWVRIWKNDFPDGTLANKYANELKVAQINKPTKLDGEIKSAYSTAQILKNTPIVGSLNQYEIHDQGSDFMKIVKDDALNNTLRALKLPKDIESDILSSVDIILVRSNKREIIKKDFLENISGDNVDDMEILNNLAYGTTGKNTYRTLTNRYFSDRDMIQISLKMVPPNRNANIQIIGTIKGAEGLELYLDPYTEFLSRVSQLKTKAELFKLVDDLVEIEKIMPTEPRAVFVVKYKLNYKKVDISDKIINIGLEIGRSGFNASTPTQKGFVGGASYLVSLPILQKYPRYNQMVREIISIRERAFNYAVDSKKIPSNLKSDYNSALNIVKKNTLVLYDKVDNENIQKFCEKYDEITGNMKDSFQEYRIGVSKLCKNKTLNSPHGALKDLNKKSFVTSGVPKTLHNDYVHAQGLWMYTRQGEDLKKYFKKQISLTLYGLMSKKGTKIFYSKFKDVITEDAFVKEFKAKNGKNKLAKVTTSPYIMIT
jgi:hypothetical protein